MANEMTVTRFFDDHDYGSGRFNEVTLLSNWECAKIYSTQSGIMLVRSFTLKIPVTTSLNYLLTKTGTIKFLMNTIDEIPTMTCIRVVYWPFIMELMHLRNTISPGYLGLVINRIYAAAEKNGYLVNIQSRLRVYIDKFVDVKNYDYKNS